MRISRKQELYSRICDWVWPHLTGDEVPAPDCQDHFSAEHAGTLVDIANILPARLAQVEDRIRIVESKLVALLTLTSVLSVAVAASLAATTTLGTVKADAKPFAWVAVFLIFYVAVQILRSLWATVAGLMRKSYKQLSPDDIVPRGGEASDAYRVRLLNLQVSHMCWNEWAIDQKVSDMAVAHTALRNVLTAGFLLIVLTLVIAAFHLA